MEFKYTHFMCTGIEKCELNYTYYQTDFKIIHT